MKKISEKVILLLTLCLCFPMLSSAETIILKSGERIEGKIIEKTDMYVKIDFQGVELLYFYDEIERIEEQLPSVFKETTPGQFSVEMTPKELFKNFSPAVVYIDTDGGFGSGFIIDKSGIVVTNYHVAGMATNYIKVKLKNGEEFTPTSVLDYNMLIDICILKIDAPRDLDYIRLGDEEKEEIGEKVLTIGNPLGQQYSLSDGLIAQKSDFTFRKLIQFTCPVSSGSSGGPLLNLKGEAVGIVTLATFSTDGITVTQNINFAIGINQIKNMLMGRRGGIPLNIFFDKNKKNQLFFQTLLSPPTPYEQYQIYKEGFTKCLNIQDKDCFCNFLYLLAQNNRATSDYMLDIAKNVAVSTKDALYYTNEGVKLIEQVGGVEKIIESYKMYFYPPKEALSNAREFVFANPYSAACFINAALGDWNFAYSCYDKYKSYAPKAEFLKALEAILELNKK